MALEKENQRIELLLNLKQVNSMLSASFLQKLQCFLGMHLWNIKKGTHGKCVYCNKEKIFKTTYPNSL